MNLRKVGAAAEHEAEAYLVRKGAEILDRNVRLGHGEIDLVAKMGDVILFVEVKARSSDRFGTPAEAVHREKRRRILSAANCYIGMHGLTDSPIRFDIIERTDGKIRHIEGAFDATGEGF